MREHKVLSYTSCSKETRNTVELIATVAVRGVTGISQIASASSVMEGKFSTLIKELNLQVLNKTTL
jgi:hypothetical protein